jgi:hypothetical protein
MYLRNIVWGCTHFIYHLLTGNYLQSHIWIPAGVEPWDAPPFRGGKLAPAKAGVFRGGSYSRWGWEQVQTAVKNAIFYKFASL